MAKVNSVMSTEIALNLVQASKSVKSMTSLVRSATSAWKAQEIELKSAGDYIQAAKTRYEGLGTVIRDQQALIDGLKAKQSALKGNTTETAEAYLKYQQQIDRATTKLASLQAQQQRAKSNMELQKSGIIGLKNAVESTTKQTNSYVAALAAQGNKWQSAKAKLTGLREVHEKMGTQLQKEREYLEKLSTEYGSDSDEVSKQKTRINELTTSYVKNGSEIKSLNSKVGLLPNSYLKVKDTGSKVTSSLKRGWESVKTAAVTASVGIGVVGAAMVSGAKKASTLQNEYKVTSNLLVTGGEKAKQATKEVAEMQKDGQKYSVAYGKSQSSIAKQYQELVKRGYTAKSALGAMKTELQGSVASGDKFSDVVKVSSQVLDAFNLRTNNTAKMTKNTKTVVNELAYAADSTATDFQSLGKGMEYVGDTAKNAGFSLSEMSSAMGILSNHGLEADKAGTGLRKAIVSLAQPSASATAALKEIGISSTKVFKDSNGNFKSLSSIMSTVEQHTKNLGTAQKAAVFKAIFGTTGMQAAQILANNSSQLSKLTKKVQEAGDKGNYVANLAKKNSNTAQQNVARFKQAWSSLTIMFGSKLLPYMTKAANQLSKLFSQKSFQSALNKAATGVAKVAGSILKVGEYAAKHTSQVKAFGIALGSMWAIAKIRNFITAWGNFMSVFKTNKVAAMATAQTKLTSATKSQTIAQRALNTVESMNPWAKAAIAIAAVVTVLVELYKHNKAFRQEVNKLYKSIKPLISQIGKTLASAFKALDVVIKGVGGFFKNFGKNAKTGWTNAKKAFSSGWTNIKKSTSDGWKATSKFFSNLWSATKKGVANSWTNTKSTFSNGWKETQKLTQSGAKAVQDKWNDLKTQTNKIANNMKNSNNPVFRNGYNTISNYTKTWHDLITGKWTDLGSDIKKTATSLFNTVKSIFKSAYDWLNNLTGGRLGDVLSTFSSIFGKIKDVVSGAISAVHKSFVGLVRGILNPFNTMLDGLRKGIN